MSKLRDNLIASIELGGKPVTAIAICFQTQAYCAAAIAAELPYVSEVIDITNTNKNSLLSRHYSHIIELLEPGSDNYYTHKAKCHAVIDAGAQGLALFDWQPEYLDDSFWGSTDYRELSPKLELFKNELETKADIIHITSALGTDISFSVKWRRWIAANGICRSDELSQMPDGEVYTCPIEETFSGTLVVDGTITRSWLPNKPERLEFKKGQLTNCSDTFAAYIKDLGSHIYQIGEFAFGCNAAHNKIMQNISVDEKAAGTVHFALGDSYFLGQNNCQEHLDMVIRNPQVYTSPLIKSWQFFAK